jgi:predicted transposase YbfD/YdcC
VRLLWALADPEVNAHLGECGEHERPWPHVAQVCRVERRRSVRRAGQVVKQTVEVSYAITSLTPEQADAARLLTLLRGHWGIENRMHWVRDVTFDEDRSQVRSWAAPQVMAALRNLTLALLRRIHCSAIATMRRSLAGRPHLAVQLVLSGRLC